MDHQKKRHYMHTCAYIKKYYHYHYDGKIKIKLIIQKEIFTWQKILYYIILYLNFNNKNNNSKNKLK